MRVKGIIGKGGLEGGGSKGKERRWGKEEVEMGETRGIEGGKKGGKREMRGKSEGKEERERRKGEE